MTDPTECVVCLAAGGKSTPLVPGVLLCDACRASYIAADSLSDVEWAAKRAREVERENRDWRDG